MNWIEDVRKGLRRLDQSTSALRKFSLVMAAFLFLLAGGSFFIGDHPKRSLWFSVIGLLILAIGLLAPKSLRLFHTLWMALALSIGYFMSRLLLTIVFFLVLTPTGLLLRLLRKDLLDERITGQKSYWKRRETNRDGLEHIERQF